MMESMVAKGLFLVIVVLSVIMTIKFRRKLEKAGFGRLNEKLAFLTTSYGRQPDALEIGEFLCQVENQPKESWPDAAVRVRRDKLAEQVK